MEEYFDEEPYLFKDCHSTYALAVAHANFFKGGQLKLPVSIRKRGKWVNVIIYQINVKTAECDTHEKIVIEPFLTPEYLGKIPKDRMFGGIVAYTKEGNPKILSSVITMKKDGTIEICPCDEEGKFFFEFYKDEDEMNAVCIEFTYIVDDLNLEQTPKLMSVLQKKNHLLDEEQADLTRIVVEGKPIEGEEVMDIN